MGLFDAFRKDREPALWEPVVTKGMLVAHLVSLGFEEDDRQDVPQGELRGFRVEEHESGTLFLQIPYGDKSSPDALSVAADLMKDLGRDYGSYGLVQPGPELAIDYRRPSR